MHHEIAGGVDEDESNFGAYRGTEFGDAGMLIDAGLW
jgi:hypothetical protein